MLNSFGIKSSKMSFSNHSSVSV